MPWVWIRRQIAERYGKWPWELDSAPYDEVALELRLMGIESEFRRKG